MDLVTCKCAACDAKLGNIVNYWTQIGKNYLTSNIEDAGVNGLHISTTGNTRYGEAGTLIAGCELQTAICAACETNIGLKCVDTPMNHVLNSGQLIFRRSSLALRSAADGRLKVDPTIKRTLKLRQDPPSPKPVYTSPPQADEPFMGFQMYQDASSTDDVDIIQLQVDVEAQREDIQRIGATGMQVVSKFEASITQVEQEMQQIRGTVDNLRQEGSRHDRDLSSVRAQLSEVQWECPHSALISRLEQQYHTTDCVVTELRHSLSTASKGISELREGLANTLTELQHMSNENDKLRNELFETRQVAEDSIMTSKEYASEVSGLRKELQHLRAEMTRERAAPVTKDSSSFSSRELDILTSSISKIGSRASQVESVQMELELFKSRVQRLESRVSSSTPTPVTQRTGPHDNGIYTADEIAEELPRPLYGEGGVRKRKPVQMGGAEVDGHHITPKRMTVTSDYSSAATTVSPNIEAWGQSSPTTSTGPGKGSRPRLTKSGSVDKRYLRRS